MGENIPLEGKHIMRLSFGRSVCIVRHDCTLINRGNYKTQEMWLLSIISLSVKYMEIEFCNYLYIFHKHIRKNITICVYIKGVEKGVAFA